MEKKKIKVGLIYGGASFEHEVSRMTAKSILLNIDKELFDVKEIYIDKNGNLDENLLKDIDIAFLAVHGPNCEDGKLQKYLEDRGIKYTGSGVAASALNMNKIRMHDAFKTAGLKVVEYFGCDKSWDLLKIKENIEKNFGYPCFVKANNAGSSVGVSRVDSESELKKALEEAFKCNEKIIVEAAVKNPREFEIAVLGNNELIISLPGEVNSDGEFYSYDAKYFHPFETKANAPLQSNQSDEIKEMAEKAYKVTGCRGYARIDFLMDGGGKIYINEINSLPGFTKISMFPKMMQAIGINYKDLITRIIQLALE
ncbi:MAG: D-alanine--D-alanine ligase [Patescibacteria group bacterium]|nr:D-alanine--D-alanine ligase [Patescibacteria group bacterium]